jgi:hypothetical protein
MKQILFTMMILGSVAVHGQVRDDFSDGDFTQNPVWTGDTGRFEINSSFQLHLKSSGSDTAILTTASSIARNGEWDFWVKLSFNTSANNFARIYLVSDQPALKGPLNGYFLQVGGSNDSVGFYRQQGNTMQRLFTAWQCFTGNTTNTFRFRLVHDSAGMWHLFSGSGGGDPVTPEGSVVDTAIETSSFFGIYCRYTSSNATKVWFDDFYSGLEIRDTIPPSVETVEILSENEVRILFSEPPDPIPAGERSNYRSDLLGSATGVTPDSGYARAFRVMFAGTFPDEFSDMLTIENLRDLQGNTAGEIRYPLSRHTLRAHDVIIDEILADPEPQTALPDAEFLEIYNRTDHAVSLKNWILEYGDSRKLFPDATIAGNEYLILSKSEWYNFYGKTLTLLTSDYTLTNDGMTLTLRDPAGRIIHSVTYTPDWFRNSFKKDGGWSLEMIDPGNPCGCQDNWAPSTDPSGGTPGGLNSVNAQNPDTEPPFFKRVALTGLQSVRVYLSEPMDSSFLPAPADWMTGDTALAADSVTWSGPDFSSLEIHLLGEPEPGKIYYLRPGTFMKDCAGNRMDTAAFACFARPDSVYPGALVINEVLPDPFPDGSRFIEIYNLSSPVFNLKDLLVGKVDTLTGAVETPVAVTEEGILCFPGTYVVLAKDPEDLKERYRVPQSWKEGNDGGTLVKMTAFPTLDDDAGRVAILRKSDGAVVDAVSYGKGLYFPLLSDRSGVSLERISPFRSSGDPTNWHSASESAGFATPGAQNSEYMEGIAGTTPVTLAPRIFSPDNDGHDDILAIGLKCESPGFMANIAVFDASGRLVRQLTRNRLLSAEDGVSWDGIDEGYHPAKPGIYIILTELIRPDGTVKRYRNTAVLALRD